MPSIRTPPLGRGTGTVRVVTINLWGRHGSWADRQAVLADGLRKLENPTVTSGDSVREFGWPYERGRRIDYVLVRCGDHGPTLNLTECARILDEPVGGVWPSDPFGVMAGFAAGDPHRFTHPLPEETQ